MCDNAKELMIEIDYVMRLLEIKDYRRTVQIFRASVGAVEFVTELSRLSKRNTEDVLGVLSPIEFFKPLAANYSMRKSGPSAGVVPAGGKIVTLVDCRGYTLSGTLSKDAGTAAVSEYMDIMREAAKSVPFVFRDNMERFTGRFLGKASSEEENPDLEEILERIENFLGRVDLGSIKYVITSGIGANEMYSHQLALVLNKHFAKSNVKWIVVNNPAHLSIIPKDACDSNSFVFEMSRSGSTKETIDFFNATKARFKKRIVAANGKQLKSAAERLSREPGSKVLMLDNTRGDIGGRQMNRKTLMVYAPLFVALSAGFKDVREARRSLKFYCVALSRANEELSYSRGSDSASVRMAEFLLAQRESGRVKFSVLYDDSLKYPAKELSQLMNEGANKNCAGGTNNNILDSYSLTADKKKYDVVFRAAPLQQMPIFLLDTDSPGYDETLVYIEGLKQKQIPCIVVSASFSGGLKEGLEVSARMSALLQDMTVYFTYITNQDANSNPAVKLVREITSAMFEILKEKKKESHADVRMTFKDVDKKITQKQKLLREQAVIDLDGKNIAREKYRKEFDEFSGALSVLAKKLGIPERESVSALIETTAKDVIMTDMGEAGGSNTAQIYEAFSHLRISGNLGKLSLSPRAVYLKTQRVLEDNGAVKICVALGKETEAVLKSSVNLASDIADYLFLMYKQRRDTFAYMTLTFMEADLGSPLIKDISENVINELAGFGISSPGLALPGVAHTGIEAVMSHPEAIFNIAIIYTNAYGGELGKMQIDEGITVDDATYIYGISNVIRMSFGGSPSVIFELKNAGGLKYVKGVLKEALALFRKKVSDLHAARGSM